MTLRVIEAILLKNEDEEWKGRSTPQMKRHVDPPPRSPALTANLPLKSATLPDSPLTPITPRGGEYGHLIPLVDPEWSVVATEMDELNDKCRLPLIPLLQGQEGSQHS